MAESQKREPTSEEYPSVISYLREDIQDLRLDMRQMRQEIQEFRTEVREEMRQGFQFVHSRIDSHFRWVLTGMLGVGGIVIASAGVVVAMLKP